MGRLLVLGQCIFLMQIKILSGKVSLGREEGKRFSLLCDLELIPKATGRTKNIRQMMGPSDSLPGRAKNEQKVDHTHFEIEIS